MLVTKVFLAFLAILSFSCLAEGAGDCGDEHGFGCCTGSDRSHIAKVDDKGTNCAAEEAEYEAQMAARDKEFKPEESNMLYMMVNAGGIRTRTAAELQLYGEVDARTIYWNSMDWAAHMGWWKSYKGDKQYCTSLKLDYWELDASLTTCESERKSCLSHAKYYQELLGNLDEILEVCREWSIQPCVAGCVQQCEDATTQCVQQCEVDAATPTAIKPGPGGCIKQCSGPDAQCKKQCVQCVDPAPGQDQPPAFNAQKTAKRKGAAPQAKPFPDPEGYTCVKVEPKIKRVPEVIKREVPEEVYFKCTATTDAATTEDDAAAAAKAGAADAGAADDAAAAKAAAAAAKKA